MPTFIAIGIKPFFIGYCAGGPHAPKTARPHRLGKQSKGGTCFMEQAEKQRALSSLQCGQSAVVRAIETQGAMRRRLQDIGLISGTRVECVGVSPLGDPAAYLIRGAVIALRREDSDGVQICT